MHFGESKIIHKRYPDYVLAYLRHKITYLSPILHIISFKKYLQIMRMARIARYKPFGRLNIVLLSDGAEECL